MCIYYPDGRLAASYQPEATLGIKTVAWSPSGQFLAMGGYFPTLSILNHYTWKPILEFNHPSNLTFPDIQVFKERGGGDEGEDGDIESWNKPHPKNRCKILISFMAISLYFTRSFTLT